MHESRSLEPETIIDDEPGVCIADDDEVVEGWLVSGGFMVLPVERS